MAEAVSKNKKLTFENEVMAFHVAIFLTSFRREYFAREFSILTIADHLNQILPKNDSECLIDPSALYQVGKYIMNPNKG